MVEAARGSVFAALSAALTPFDLSAQVLPEGTADYLDYYRLDMRDAFPGARYNLGYVLSGEHRLAVQCWRQQASRPTLLLVHGYFDHTGLYSHLVQFGLAAGYHVVAYDLPGHGLSSGPQAEIRDFSEYRQSILDVMTAVQELVGQRYVIAQSTGGAAVMDYLQTGILPAFDRVVLLAPLVRPHAWWRVKLAYRLLNRFVSDVPRRFAENSQDGEFLEFLRTDPLQSQVIPVCWIAALARWLPEFLARPVCNQEVLVLQGDADETVDWRYNLKQIERLFSRSRIHCLPAGRHHLANEIGSLRAQYLRIIEDFLAETSPPAGGQTATLDDTPAT